MRLVLIASFLLAMASRAAAQPGTLAPLPAVPSTTSSPVAPVDGDRNEDTAVFLAAGGTLASWTALLVAAGADHGHNAGVPFAAVSALLAPSLGHWYAGTPLTGWLGLRVGAVVGLFYVASRCEDCNFDRVELAVLAIYGIGTLGDIATTRSDVRRHNEERRMLRDLAVVPIIQRGGGGIVLGARF
jgi:hypothetical protein